MSNPARPDGREPLALRPIRIVPDWLKWAEGSCLVEWGDNRILCSATLTDRVPNWLVGKGSGWLTAEYGMLPRSTDTRSDRPGPTRQAPGRHSEIQRLIGRALRMAVDLKALGERTLSIDCDVLQADGGTRTASVTGGYVAVALALRRAGFSTRPNAPRLDAALALREPIVAVSVGLDGGRVLVDPSYEEDRVADVDCNFVFTAAGKMVEVQGTGEHAPFDADALARMVAAAQSAVPALVAAQRTALDAAR